MNTTPAEKSSSLKESGFLKKHAVIVVVNVAVVVVF